MHLTALINNSWISVLKCPLSVQLWFNNLQGSPDAELKLLSEVAAALPLLCNRSSVKSQSKSRYSAVLILTVKRFPRKFVVRTTSRKWSLTTGQR